jgi:hypothetical protein
MKMSFTLGARGPLTREKAWTCLSANLGFPGTGSLMAGRFSGYPQALLAVAGMLMSMFFGVRFALWFLANWSRLQDSGGDAMGNLLEMWLAMRWAVAGMGLFAFSWIWGLVSGLMLLASAKKTQHT